MSFERPSLTELIARIQQDFISRLDLATALLRRAVVRVFARVVAGATHMLHGHLDFISRQILPNTSESEFLIRQGRLFGVDPIVPDFAVGSVIALGDDGTEIPEDTILIRTDDAVEYVVDTDAEIATVADWTFPVAVTVGVLRKNFGNVYECVTAGTTEDAGIGPTGVDPTAIIDDDSAQWRWVGAGTAAAILAVTASVADEDSNATYLNGDSQRTLSFQSPISGAETEAPIAYLGLTGGADAELEEDYRTRVIERYRDPPMGGTSADYVAWAKLVSGVTRVWVTPEGLGPGTVLVRFVRDNDDDIFPDSGEVAAVQSVLDENAPAHATVTAFAPEADPQDFEISITPDTAAIRAAVEAELADLLYREGDPRGATIYLSQMRTAIGTASQITDYTLSSPVADYTSATNKLPTMGTITWV